MEQTDNILWLLKQAWYFSLTTVNDAVSSSVRLTGCWASAGTAAPSRKAVIRAETTRVVQPVLVGRMPASPLI